MQEILEKGDENVVDVSRFRMVSRLHCWERLFVGESGAKAGKRNQKENGRAEKRIFTTFLSPHTISLLKFPLLRTLST